MDIILLLLPLTGVVALSYTLWQTVWIMKQNAGNHKMIDIATSIAKGATAFLKAEYKSISYFVLVVSIVLGYMGITTRQFHVLIVIAFILGAALSALSGWLGMKIATKANVRTAEAAKSSLAKAFNISFSGGTVMGMGVTGMAMLGLSGLFIFFFSFFLPNGVDSTNRHLLTFCLETLIGFSLGAESVALFARVAGGIYTKAADVGADIVGKLEADIPEDDPRNPATIADNVGDNVGDVAGMGADLFGSYVATILAAMVLGNEVIATQNPATIMPILLPMLIGGVGLLLSLVATLFVSVGQSGNVQGALNRGNWIANILTAVAAYCIVDKCLPTSLVMRMLTFAPIDVFYAILTGLIVGLIVSHVTEYFTAMGSKPVKYIARQSCTGHATNIIAGLSVGMVSTVVPMLLFAVGICVSFHFAGFYGVAMAAAGMMSTTAIQLSIDAFGPIADNAGGIAAMSGLPQEVRERTDVLDTVGNTTAASGKGFAIASAALTSLALFAAYVKTANINAIDIYKAPVLAGLFIGSVIPFLFSALAMSAVGEAAMAMVHEVRRQFKEIKGILEGISRPDYERCVDISTKAALRGILLPGSIVIFPPIFVGFYLGPEVLGGMLAGVTVSGVLMALFQTNAGGAWDNAKKSFEQVGGIEIDGQRYYKGSEVHKASVTGDTVGDPLKDTSGPSMNILIKLTAIIALIIAPYIALPETPLQAGESLQETSRQPVGNLEKTPTNP